MKVVFNLGGFQCMSADSIIDRLNFIIQYYDVKNPRLGEFSINYTDRTDDLPRLELDRNGNNLTYEGSREDLHTFNLLDVILEILFAGPWDITKVGMYSSQIEEYKTEDRRLEWYEQKKNCLERYPYKEAVAYCKHHKLIFPIECLIEEAFKRDCVDCIKDMFKIRSNRVIRAGHTAEQIRSAESLIKDMKELSLDYCQDPEKAENDFQIHIVKPFLEKT